MDKALPATGMPATVIAEDLLPGDLIFQLRSGGEAEWVISRLFAGRDGAAINHVALYRRRWHGYRSCYAQGKENLSG